MKTIDLSDKTYAALQRLAAAQGLAPDEFLTGLLQEERPIFGRDGLFLFLVGPEFRATTDPTDRYLSLLAWCARNHAGDFADFVSHQESGHRYLMLNRDEIEEVRERNHARQIDGTQFWAVMTIDGATKLRFLRRFLEFIGCREETVTEACRALGLAAADSGHSGLLGAA